MQFLVNTTERVPRNCVWEITQQCNLRCVHCECSAGTRRSDELDTAEALELCDQLAQLGTERVQLSGGEPLIRKDWYRIARRLKDHGISVFLITNGHPLLPAVVQRCLDVGVDWVSISIDGLMPIHDSIRRYPPGVGGRSPFRRAFEALALCRAKGLKAGVTTHINGRNLAELEQLHEALAVVGVDGWQLQLGSPQGRMLDTEEGYLLRPDQLPQLAQFIATHHLDPFPITPTDDIGYYTHFEPELRRFDGEHIPHWAGCFAGIVIVAIEANGDVKGCPSLPSSQVEGNLRQRSLAEIWHDPNTFAYNRAWDSRRLRGYCRKCCYRRLCRAGCTSFGLASTGSYYENRHCLHRVEMLGDEA